MLHDPKLKYNFTTVPGLLHIVVTVLRCEMVSILSNSRGEGWDGEGGFLLAS